MLPTSKIQVHANPRKSVDDDAQNALVESIGLHGVITPITVRRSDDGEGWTLIAGQRRLLAALTNGLEDIPAIVLEGVDADREQAISMIENLHREPLKPMEEAAAFKQATVTMSEAQIAAAYSVSEQLVRDRIALLDIPEALHEYIDNGSIPLNSTRVLANVTRHSKALGEALAAAMLKGNVSVSGLQNSPPHAIQAAVRSWNVDHPDDQLLAFPVREREISVDEVGWTEEQQEQARAVAQVVHDSYDWSQLLNETDVDAARSFGCLLEVQSSDGVDSAFVTDPGWLFEYGLPALERKAKMVRDLMEKERARGGSAGGRKKKKSEMNEAELAAYSEQRETEKKAKDDAIVDNEKLGTNLMAKFSPKLDKRSMLTLALVIGEKCADSIGRGCRYTVPELRTVTEKKSGGARVEYVSGPEAYEWWRKRLKRLKTPEEILHHVLFGLASSEFVDETAVAQSNRVYASPVGYIEGNEVGKLLFAISRAQVPPRMKERFEARAEQRSKDLDWQRGADDEDSDLENEEGS
jgi:ParB/RepB/Spo0J family partition protein